MLIHFSFLTVLILAGMLIGMLTAVVLIAEKKNRAANRFLATLVILSLGPLAHNFLIESGIYNRHPNLYFLPVIYSLGIGPLLYLYVNRLIDTRRVSNHVLLLHLLPLLIQVLLYTYCFAQDANTKYRIYIEIFETYGEAIQNTAVYVSIAIYLYLSFQEINTYKRQLDHFYSNDHHLALSWLRRLLYAFMLYYILLVLFIVMANSFHFSEDYFPGDFIRCLIIFLIARFALRQNSLLEMQRNIRAVEAPVPEPAEIPLATDNVISPTDGTVNQSAPVPKEVNTALLQKIISLTESEQLWLNEELTVADLAAKLGYSTRTVSQTINTGLQKSFSRFINEYRVNAFRQRRSSGEFSHLTIMSVAYDCGFNSKSAFNRIYKDITGSLPKEQ